MPAKHILTPQKGDEVEVQGVGRAQWCSFANLGTYFVSGKMGRNSSSLGTCSLVERVDD